MDNPSLAPPELPAFGARFRLTEPVERFPHYLAPAGATGTIVEASKHVINLHMDEYLPGAEAWDNEITWTEDDDYDETGKPAQRPSVAAAFYRTATALTEPAIPTRAQTPREANDAPFERDTSEGSSLVVEGGTDASGEPSWFDVYHRGTRIGYVFFHEATRGAQGLLGASHWCARTTDGRCVNRTATGISLETEPTAGERTREAAVALLIAAHIAAS
ncbi:MAG: hypothetical protein ACYDHN_12525 [Solirubrobacteraceae bacterium]